MLRLAAFIRYGAITTLPLLGVGEAEAWTVSKASACDGTSAYQYSHQVTIVSGSTATNAGMSVKAEWWPSPKATKVTISTWEMGTVLKGSLTVERMCEFDPWATGAKCTGDKVTQQSNPKWGLSNVLKAAPDVLAPKDILAPMPVKVPVPQIFSEKWGGGGLPVAISVFGTGQRCSLRKDEIRAPGGMVKTWGPHAIKAGGEKIQLTQALFQQMYKESGTYAVRSRIFLWSGNGWVEGDWSQWFEFPFGVVARRGPPGNYKPVQPVPPPNP